MGGKSGIGARIGPYRLTLDISGILEHLEKMQTVPVVRQFFCFCYMVILLVLVSIVLLGVYFRCASTEKFFACQAIILDTRQKVCFGGEAGKFTRKETNGISCIPVHDLFGSSNVNKMRLNMICFLCHQFLLFAFWWSSFQHVKALHARPESSHMSSKSELASPPSIGLFEPIEISPAVIPQYPFPRGTLPPMYPSVPKIYDPVLTGRCPVNFSSISSITEKTASDCSIMLAGVVGNVICCPQFGSLLHILQGAYSANSNKLVLENAEAEDCFADVNSVLASRGANSSIPAICTAKSLNLTGGSCPVKDTATFERTINTSKLLEACRTVDPLKECCRPICQPAIMEAAVQLSGLQSIMSSNKNFAGAQSTTNTVNDCKGVVYAWISRKLSFDEANTAFRILSSCKVNKVCPLNFTEPSEVIQACRNVGAPSPSCCSSLSTYIAGLQKQMLITNRQAIICSTVLGSMLQKAGVMANVFEVCDVDLKDFSLQAYGQEGCLLRSLPADIIYDNDSGYSFTCDLSDNIAAPWPSSSSLTSLSLCAPEMSLPALPTSETKHNHGRCLRLDLFVLFISLLFYVHSGNGIM